MITSMNFLESDIPFAGVIGYPIAHSASPVMHRALYDYHSINAQYLPFHVPPNQLKSFVEGLKASSCVGCNITIPHKEAVLDCCDELDPIAAKMGAVNTLTFRDGQVIGSNTDGRGLIHSFKNDANQSFTSKNVLIIGAGGAARGIAFSLISESPDSITITNRSFSKAKILAEELHHESIKTNAIALTGLSAEFIASFDILIQTTSVGMSPNIQESPISDVSWKASNQVCIDIIYNPPQTKFMSLFAEAGATVYNGAGMLAGQGVLSASTWFNQPLDYSTMKTSLLNYLGHRS